MPSVTVYEASKQSGLAVESIRSYCKRGRSTLIRHQDYFVGRVRSNRYRLMITADGLKRLCLRAYQVRAVERLRPGRRSAIQSTLNLLVRDMVKPWQAFSGREQYWRLATEAQNILDSYLSNPCAVPNCPCIIHALGVPQLSTLIEAWNAGRHNSSHKPPWERSRIRRRVSSVRALDELGYPTVRLRRPSSRRSY